MAGMLVCLVCQLGHNPGRRTLIRMMFGIAFATFICASGSVEDDHRAKSIGLEPTTSAPKTVEATKMRGDESVWMPLKPGVDPVERQHARIHAFVTLGQLGML